MEYPVQEQMNTQPYLPTDEERQTIFTGLEDKQLRFFKISYPLLYLLTYFYSAVFINDQTLAFFPVTIGFVLLSEALIKKLDYPSLQIKNLDSGLEARIFLIMTLAQALALSIWGLHRQLEFFQFLAIHISFAFYILSRTGWLSQGRLGILIWFDTIQAFCILPFKNFIAAILVFIQGNQSDTSDSSDDLFSKKLQQLVIIVSSFFVAGILVYFVWSQLRQVSDSFASFFSNTADFIENLLDSLFSSIDSSVILFQACLAVPVSLYLYGLIAGSLLGKKDTKLSYKKFQASICPLRVAPAFAAYIIIGSLCLTYALFFLTGLSELGQLLSGGTVTQAISPQNASTVAVAGFWQLVRVSILNFAVLGVFYLIAKIPLWDQKGTRLAATILFIFAGLLALLAGWKLFGIYIYLYGPTPLRLISAWFILVLLVWCLLTLIRFYKPIQAIRIGIFYALISFTLLCYLYPMLLPAG